MSVYSPRMVEAIGEIEGLVAGTSIASATANVAISDLANKVRDDPELLGYVLFGTAMCLDLMVRMVADAEGMSASEARGRLFAAARATYGPDAAR